MIDMPARGGRNVRKLRHFMPVWRDQFAYRARITAGLRANGRLASRARYW